MKPLHISIILYIFFILIIYTIKPRMFFLKNGKMKNFGIGKYKTLFTFLNVSLLFGCFTFVLSNIIINNTKYIEKIITPEPITSIIESPIAELVFP